MISRSRSFIFASAFLLLTACGRPHDESEHRSANPDSVAGKTGDAAYKVSKEAEKAAVVIGKETGKAAKAVAHKVAEASKDAHAGWKNASEQSKAKQDQ